MRQWIEKLAKLIEKEGVRISCGPYKVLNYEIGYTFDMTRLVISNYITGETASIKLYEEEKDILKKAFNRCEERTTDSIIEQINNL
jgi:hypothetical protein